MKRKKAVILFVIMLGLVVGSIVFLRIQSYQNKKLPDELFKKFDCGRKTLDLRFTDKYCTDYELYKKDQAAGNIE
jgi:hypothetical protein